MPSSGQSVLKNLQLTNFCGFEQLELKLLNRLNLIVGDNSTGKTSLLESLILLLGGAEDLECLPDLFRAKPHFASTQQDYHEGFWKWLHTNLQSERTKVYASGIKGTTEVFFRPRHRRPSSAILNDAWCRFIEWFDSDSQMFAQIFYPEQSGRTSAPELVTFSREGFSFQEVGSLIRCAAVSTREGDFAGDAEQFNLVALRQNGEEDMEVFMRRIEPRLRKLRYRKLPDMSAPKIYAELEGISEFMPAHQLGQGFAQALRIYCQIRKDDSKSVFLIDGVENGIYWKNLLPFWNGILNLLTSDGSQLFATTNNFECIKAAHQAACEHADNGGSYDLNIIHLKRVDWGVEATELGREAMKAVIANGSDML